MVFLSVMKVSLCDPLSAGQGINKTTLISVKHINAMELWDLGLPMPVPVTNVKKSMDLR